MDDPKFMTGAQADAALFDVGLRQYMMRVYNYMAGGLALTGVVAFGTYTLSTTTGADGNTYLTGLGQALYLSPLKWVVMLAPLGMVMLLAARVRSMSFAGAQTAFAVFAALMGLSLSSIFLQFAGESIAKVFFISSRIFWRAQHLRLHDQARPFGHGHVPVHGRDRCVHRRYR